MAERKIFEIWFSPDGNPVDVEVVDDGIKVTPQKTNQITQAVKDKIFSDINEISQLETKGYLLVKGHNKWYGDTSTGAFIRQQ